MRDKPAFNYKLLPYFLILPQLFIVAVFFFLPAIQSVWSSFFVSDNFGLHFKFVGLRNYIQLFSDPSYYHSIWVSVVFSFLVTFIPRKFIGLGTIVNGIFLISFSVASLLYRNGTDFYI